ncbi:hypothetical protein [Erwinia mallotivora]|uniref:Uncharacterized protein n=1 Tax=Erwinia mallotivora TaxID=69222 RepID=A0A014N6H8_9GAMM|nr:hypothetical protein [Erwinia mallotivora]EXU75018.1 hypothetical protein BG55_15055 [Erwinia mallotivora]
MAMVKIVRRSAKTVLFILLFCLFARLIDSSKFISPGAANHFSSWLHGSASQENFDDLWFFSDVLLTLLASAVAYNVVVVLYHKAIKRRACRVHQH